ncbi:uncharacterized protein [Maniola hyperantus]|uniref:uncharacterized protein isoform X1 n=1 Tax=Aphantopus hyperantus TaxID=2795564 RepID=UPI001569D888|nr:uncharacterized protein LOC117995147 [Maniola hyperantus]XP_034839039.1 uncharacterized protein LOC117995147 [Maniola hyperantus]
MLRLLIFGLLLLAVKSNPINGENNRNIDRNVYLDNDFNSENAEELKKALNDVAYVQNFKNMMADYVKSQYSDLTEHKMETIKEYLVEFCHKFAIDLKNIIENGVEPTVRERIDDGLPDSTFENVKNSIKTELPGMRDDTADHVAYVLRKNLFLTRRKIDKVINDSKVAEIEN